LPIHKVNVIDLYKLHLGIDLGSLVHISLFLEPLVGRVQSVCQRCWKVCISEDKEVAEGAVAVYYTYIGIPINIYR
jgi:hypothetical protein